MPFMDSPPAPGTPSGGSSDYLAGLSAATGIPLAGGPVGGLTSQDPFIFMNQFKITKNSSAAAAEHTLESGSIQGSKLSDLQRQFIKSSEENKRHWAYLLGLTGYAGAEIATDPRKAADFAKNASLQDVLTLHEKFLHDAADQFNVYRRKVTPTQLMQEMLNYRLGDKFNGNLNSITPDGAGSLGGNSAAGTRTATAKSVDLMSPEDAKGLIRATLQNELGRDPTQAEYEDFISAVHAAERNNPSVTKTTYTTDAEGNMTNQSSTTRGGLSDSGVNQLLYEKAKSLPSWAVWQAVGTYAPALFQALDSAVPGT